MGNIQNTIITIIRNMLYSWVVRLNIGIIFTDVKFPQITVYVRHNVDQNINSSFLAIWLNVMKFMRIAKIYLSTHNTMTIQRKTLTVLNAVKMGISLNKTKQAAIETGVLDESWPKAFSGERMLNYSGTEQLLAYLCVFFRSRQFKA